MPDEADVSDYVEVLKRQRNTLADELAVATALCQKFKRRIKELETPAETLNG